MLKISVLAGFWPVNIFKPSGRSFAQSSVKNQKAVSRAKWALVLIAINICLLFSYVYGVNDLASNGYAMQSLKKQHATLSEENKKLNLTAAESASIMNIQNVSALSNFVPAGTPTFLVIEPQNQLSRR